MEHPILNTINELDIKIKKQLEKDLYFMRIAKEVSKASKCLSRKIGSVLVKNGCVVSTGYNGPAKGVLHCNERITDFYTALEVHNGKEMYNLNSSYSGTDCPRRWLKYKSGQGLHLCQAGHSERNAIIQAARNGIATLGTTLYAYCGIPCKDCSIELINAGIKEIICLKKDKNYDQYSEIILSEANIILRQINEENL
jgi:dCMP deaminase